MSRSVVLIMLLLIVLLLHATSKYPLLNAWPHAPSLLLEKSMGSPIYYNTPNGWKMAHGFNPAPGFFAFVTDQSWIQDFYANFPPDPDPDVVEVYNF